MSIGPVTAEFLSAWCRLLDLLSNPEDIPFLSGLLEREIIVSNPAWTGGAHGYEQSPHWETRATARPKQSLGSRQTTRGHFALKNLRKLRAWRFLRFTIISGRSRQ